MPLAALVNGERRVAPLMDPEDWASLRRSRPWINLCCCNSKGFMRVSKLGTRHFVHARKPDDCTSGPESEQHQYLKTLIAVTSREAGWDADVEVCDADGKWRADVMAIRGTLRVAFEVQLSPISYLELESRQQAYEKSNVRGCWFYGPGALTTNPPVGSDIPLFSLHRKDSAIPKAFGGDENSEFADHVQIGSQRMSVKQGVVSLLRGQFRLCASQRVATVKAIFIFRFSRCFSCGKDFDIFSIMEDDAYCGNEPSMDYPGTWRAASLYKSGAPWIVEKVERFIETHKEMNLTVCAPDWYTAKSSGRRHYTFCCYHCGALIGSEVFEQLLENGFCSQSEDYCLDPVAPIQLSRRTSEQNNLHWCFSESGRFCGPPFQKSGVRSGQTDFESL